MLLVLDQLLHSGLAARHGHTDGLAVVQISWLLDITGIPENWRVRDHLLTGDLQTDASHQPSTLPLQLLLIWGHEAGTAREPCCLLPL